MANPFVASATKGFFIAYYDDDYVMELKEGTIAPVFSRYAINENILLLHNVYDKIGYKYEVMR